MSRSPLTLRNLTKRFGEKTAVDDVSLELREGEVFGFLGPNGAGKSTTIRLIMDFLRPTVGSVELLGATTSELRIRKHREIGYLAGDIALYDSMTGRAFLKAVSRMGFSVDWKYVEELAMRFEATLDKPIKNLSKGNRQKIGLIQAFMCRPKLLILDEPTSGLDPLMKQVFYDLVREFAKRGATIFLSSHDLSEVQKICDRAGFIRNGKIVAVENVAAAKNLTMRRYLVNFGEKFDLERAQKITSIKNAVRHGDEFEFTVAGEVAEFVEFIVKFKPQTLRESELEIEELFMRLYDGGEK